MRNPGGLRQVDRLQRRGEATGAVVVTNSRHEAAELSVKINSGGGKGAVFEIWQTWWGRKR